MTTTDSSSSGFVVLMGADTIAVERFTRTPSRLSGELTSPTQGIVQSWTFELSPTGDVTSATSEVRRAGDASTAAPLQVASIAFDGDSDSATVVVTDSARRAATPPGALPFVNLSAGVIEQIVRRARAMGGDSATVPLLPFGAVDAFPARVRWATPDTAVVTVGGVALHVAVDRDGTLRGATVPAQGVRFVRADGDVAMAIAAPPPDYSAPRGAPYDAHDVTLRNEAAGVTIAGTLTVPRGAGAASRVPAVVIITGSGPQDRDGAMAALPGWAGYRELADSLSRRGIAVLRLDDRGVGGTEVGGPFTSEDLAGDVRAALAFLRTRPELDPARLALLGHSEGGAIAPMVARTDSALRAVVLVAAPSRTGRVISDSQVVQTMRERGIPATQHDSLLALNRQVVDSMATASPWLAFFLDYDPLPAARELRVPVLIVQGATDLQVTADQAGELAAAIRAGGNRDVTVRVFPDVNHLLVRDPSGAFSGYTSLPSLELAPEVVGEIVEWLVGRLAG
ncbi:MAG TPA: alpha/beta fold hydrolase [Gemmatimonadales bacterium]